MDISSKADFSSLAFELLAESVKCKEAGDFHKCYKKLALARGINIYFDNRDLIKMYDNFFELGRIDGEITEQEAELLKLYGIDKSLFLIKKNMEKNLLNL
ncbi:MAG: hypothetical protein AABX30_02370 [Nanoarchaeota archaeon]